MVRHKNRYFLVEFMPTNRKANIPLNMDKSHIFHTLMNYVRKLHGDFGAASVQASCVVKYCNPYTKVVLVRVRHGPHRFVSSTLPLMKKLGCLHIETKMLYSSATMTKCFKYLREYQMSQIEYYWCLMRSDKDRRLMAEAMLNIDMSCKKYEPTE